MLRPDGGEAHLHSLSCAYKKKPRQGERQQCSPGAQNRVRIIDNTYNSGGGREQRVGRMEKFKKNAHFTICKLDVKI